MKNGQHPLRKLMVDKDATHALAKAVGCTASHLRNLRDGRKTASLQLAKRLSDQTGIRMDAFIRPDDK